MLCLRTTFIAAFWLLLQAPLLAGIAFAHGDHGAAPPPAGRSLPRIESHAGAIELVAIAGGHALTIYLDRPATNEPITGASVEVTGEGQAPLVAKDVGDGVYRVEADWLDRPGARGLVFLVTAGDEIELLNGTLDVPAPQEAAARAPIALAGLLTEPAAWLLAAFAAAIGFVTALAFRRPQRSASGAGESDGAAAPAPAPGTEALPSRRAAAILAVPLLAAGLLALAAAPLDAHEGHDHGAAAPLPADLGNAPRRLPGGEAFVPKPTQRLLAIRTRPVAIEQVAAASELIGSVVADPATSGRVQAPMDGLVQITPRGIAHVGQRVEAGDVLAILTPTIPVADRGSLQQLTAEVEGKYRLAQLKLQRLTRIAGVVPQKDIEDTRAELEALAEQRRVLEPKAAEKIDLVAPVGGVIAAANVRAGQVVSARDTLFEIVDPSRLWVEAIGVGGHEAAQPIRDARAIDTAGHALALSFVGAAPALRQQAQPLLFRIEEAHAELAIGAPLKVVLRHEREARGIVLPEGAIVRSGAGLPQVWIKVSAERFEPVGVRVAPLDGENVLVTAGLEPGSRVVVSGAELINQVR